MYSYIKKQVAFTTAWTVFNMRIQRMMKKKKIFLKSLEVVGVIPFKTGSQISLGLYSHFFF